MLPIMKMLFNTPVNAMAQTAIKLLAENRRTTGEASRISSIKLEFESKMRNAASGPKAPGQKAEAKRWVASTKR